MSAENPGRDDEPVVEREIIDDLAKRFTGFPVPKEQPFDPSAADRKLLEEYGLPAKPDRDRQPLLRRAWDRGFGKSMFLQQFRFKRMLVIGAGYRLLPRHIDELPVSETRFETSGNWSGAYITANRDRRFLQIWGIWTIPAKLEVPPAPLQGTAGLPYACSNWIGLDGQRLYLNSSLPQIGTVSTLNANGSPGKTEAWTQWWARDNAGDNPPVPIGLAVQPGNEVLCVLTAANPQTVTGVMVNLSATPPTGMAVQGTAPTVVLPDGSTAMPDIAGATAEWIVERPRIEKQKSRYNFPDYDKTCFQSCVAVEGDDVNANSWLQGLAQDLEGERLIRMFDVLAGPQRTVFTSMPNKEDDLTLRLTYGGFR